MGKLLGRKEENRLLELENNTPKQIAVVYTRVSGAKQVRDGDGLACETLP